MTPFTPPAPVYLVSTLAETAVALATPTIEALMANRTSRKFVHIVVLDLNGQILFEQAVGPQASDPELAENIRVCGSIARSKAAIHFRTGRPSRVLQDRAPHLLLVGDTVYGGSAEYEGIIVAASGVQDYFDEAISALVAAILWGLVKARQAGHRDQHQGQPFYLNSAVEG